MYIYFHIEFNTKFSFLQLPLLLHDKIQKRKAWYHCSLRNKARSYGTCNTSKKGKDKYSMRMKINKNYIELFCTLKNDVYTFQPIKKVYSNT